MSARLFKQTFTTSGTWKCPAGILFIILTGCGGGGGGGGGATVGPKAGGPGELLPYVGCGGSGGQAGQTVSQIFAVQPGITYSVSIGTGGSLGLASTIIADTANDNGYVGRGFSGGNGGATVMNPGGILFLGGQGGRGGELVLEQDNDELHFDLAAKIISSTTVPAFPAPSGASDISSGGGGGSGGGTSNNILSVGGRGGDGSGVISADPGVGGNGVSGGGGGGGGAGRNRFSTYGINILGANGGTGGSGFLEIAWVA